MKGDNKMEGEIKNDQELYSYFRDRNSALTKENFLYLMKNYQVKQLLNDYLSNILLHKPDDVFKFTKDYFKFLSDTGEPGESDKFTILVGPNCVGKSDLLNKLIAEYPDYFEIPKYVCTQEKENCNVISQEQYLEYQNNKLLLLDTFNEEKNYFEGLTSQEINRIMDSGKIAIMETCLEDGLKINQTSFPVNFIGILPPSLDHLRARIEKSKKLNIASVNKELEKAKDEIKDIENYTFFCYRIINDIFETGYKDLKNAIISLYPKLKYKKAELEELKKAKVEITDVSEEKKETNDK